MNCFTFSLHLHRWFLRVLSDLLLGVALKDILVHVGALMKIVTKVNPSPLNVHTLTCCSMALKLTEVIIFVVLLYL